MTQKFYLRNVTASPTPTTGKKSTALTSTQAENATGTDETRSLLSTRGTTQASILRNTDASNTAELGYHARFTSVPLQAGTYGSGTWTIGLAASESNAASNAFLALSVYFWRPSNNTVVGFVYDSSTALGSEFATSETGIVATFAGTGRTIQKGDVLVVEIWRTQTQQQATARTNTIYFDGTTDPTNNVAATSASSYISAPADILEISVVTKTQLTNSFLKKLNITKTQLTNSFLKKLDITKTQLTNSRLKKLGDTRTQTVNSVLAKVTKIHTTLTIKKKLDNTKTQTLNSVLAKVTKTQLTNTFKKQLSITETQKVDSVLAKVTKIHTTLTFKKKLDITDIQLTNSSLKKLGYIKEQLTDSTLAKVTKIHSTDSTKKILDKIKTHSTSTLFKDTDPNAPHIHLIDLTLKKLDNIRTQLTDSRLKNVITITSNTNSFLKKISTKTHTVNTLLKDTDPSKKWELDLGVSYGSYSVPPISPYAYSASPYSVKFSPDGTKMYITGNNYPQPEIYQYNLSTAWNVTTATYNSQKAGLPTKLSNLSSVYAFCFKSDGTKLYVSTGRIAGASYRFEQFSLATPWDITTSTYDNVSLTVDYPYEASPHGMAWNSDGTKLIIIGEYNYNIDIYTVSTPFNISTAGSPVQNSGLQYLDIPHDIAFSSDGTKVYIPFANTRKVYQWNLTTAWDVSSITKTNYTKRISVAPNYPCGFTWDATGSRFYVADEYPEKVFQYNLLDYNHTTSTVLAKVTKTQLTNSKLKRLDNSLQHSTSTLFKDTDPNAPHIHLIDLTLKKLGETKTHSTNTLIKDTKSYGHTTNTRLKQLDQSIQHATDTRLIKRIRVHTTDVLFKDTDPDTPHEQTVDSVLAKVTKTHSTNTLFKDLEPNVSHEQLTDSTLAKVTKTHSTDTLFKDLEPNVSHDHSTSSILAKVTKTHSTDTLFKDLDPNVSHQQSTDSTLAKVVYTHNTQSFLKIINKIKTFTTNTRLKKLNNLLQHSTNTLFKDTDPNTLHEQTVNSVLAKVTKTQLTNSRLKKLDQFRQHTTNLILAKVTKIHSTDTLFKDTDPNSPHQHFTNTSKKRLDDGNYHETKTLIKQTLQVQHTTNTKLKRLGSTDQHSTNLNLAKVVKTFLTNTLKKKIGYAKTQTTSSHLARVIWHHETDVLLKDTDPNAPHIHLTQSDLAKVIKTQKTNSILAKVTKIHSTSTRLTKPKPHTTDTHRKIPNITKFNRTNTFRKILDTPRQHTTSLNIKKEIRQTHQTTSFLDNLGNIINHSYTTYSYTTNSFTNHGSKFKNQTVDSRLFFVTSYIKTFNTNSVLAKASKQHTTSSYLQSSTSSESFSDDSFTISSYNTTNLTFLTHTTSSQLHKPKVHTTSSHIVKRYLKTFTTNTWLFKPKSSISNSFTITSYTTASYTIDQPISNHATNSTLKNLSNIKTHGTSTHRARLKSHLTTSFLQSLGSVTLNSFTRDSYTKDSYTTQLAKFVTHQVTSFLKRVISKTHTVNTYVKLPSVKQHTTNTWKLKTTTILSNSFTITSYNIDSYTIDQPSTKHTTSTSLKKLNNTLSHSTVTHRARVTSHNTSSVLQSLGLVGINSYTKDSYTRTSYTTQLNKVINQLTTSFLKRVISKIHTTNTITKVPIVKQHTTDTWKLKTTTILSNSFTPTSYVVDSYTIDQPVTKQFVNSYLAKMGVVKQHTSDTNKARLRQHTTESRLQTAFNTRSDSYTKDSYTVSSYTTQSSPYHTTSVVLTRTQLTHFTNIVKRSTSVKLHTISTVISVRGNSFVDASYTSASFTIPFVKTHTTNSVLYDKNRRHTTSTNLARPKLHITSSYLQKQLSTRSDSYAPTSYTVSSYTVTQGLTHGTDVDVKRAIIKTHITTSVLKQTTQVQQLTSTVVSKPDQAYTKASFTSNSYTAENLTFIQQLTDSFLTGRLFKQHLTNSHLKTPRTKSHTVNTYGQKALSVRSDSYTPTSYDVDSFTTTQPSKTHTTNSALKNAYIKSHSTSTHRARLRSHTTSTHLQSLGKVGTHSYTKDSYTKDSYTTELLKVAVHTTLTFAIRVISKLHSTNTVTKVPRIKSHTVTTYIQKQLPVRSDSYTFTSFTTASYKIDQPSTKHFTDVVLHNPYSGVFHTTSTHRARLTSHNTTSFLQSLGKVGIHSYTRDSYDKDSFTTDIIKVATHVAESVLKRVIVKSQLTTSFLVNRLTKQHTTSTWKLKTATTLSNSFTPTSYIVDSYTIDQPTTRHYTNTYLAKMGVVKSHTTSVNKARLKTHTTESRLQRVLGIRSNSFTEYSYTIQSYTVEDIPTHTTNSVLSKPIKTHTTSTYSKSSVAKLHQTQTVITEPEDSFTAQSYTTKSFVAVEVVRKTHYIDSFLKAIPTRVHTVNSALRVPKQAIHSTNTFRIKVKTVLSDSYESLSYTPTSYTVDQPVTKHLVNSYLKSLRTIITHATSTHRARLTSHTTSSVLQSLGSVGVNSYRRDSYTKTSYTTELLKIVGHGTQSFFKRIISNIHTTQTATKIPSVKLHLVNSWLQRQKSVRADSYTPSSYTPISYTVDQPVTRHFTDTRVKGFTTLTNKTDTYIVRIKKHTTSTRLYKPFAQSDFSYTLTSYTNRSYTVQSCIQNTDALLRRLGLTLQHSVNSRLHKPKPHNTDTLKRKVNIVRQHTTNSLKKTLDVPKTQTVSSVLAKVTKTHKVDTGVKKLGEFTTHATDVLFKDTDPNAPHIHLINSLLKKLDNVIVQTVDSTLAKVTKIHSTDTLFKDLEPNVSHEQTVDSTLAKVTKIQSVESFLKRLDEPRTHTTDSVLAKVTKVQSTDSDVAKVVYTQTINSNVAKVVYTQSVDSHLAIVIWHHETDTLLKDTDPNAPYVHSTDVAVKKLGEFTDTTTDTRLKRLDDFRQSSTDTLKQKFSGKTQRTDIHIVYEIVKTQTTDSDLAKVTKTQSIDSDITKVVYTQTVDSVLAKVVYTQSVDSTLAKVTKTHSSDSTLAKVTKIHTVNSDLAKVVYTQSVDSHLAKVIQHHETDSVLAKVTKVHTTDTLFKDLEPNVAHDHSTNLDIAKVVYTHTTDTLFKDLEPNTPYEHSTDSVLAKVTKIHSTDTLFRDTDPNAPHDHSTNLDLAKVVYTHSTDTLFKDLEPNVSHEQTVDTDLAKVVYNHTTNLDIAKVIYTHDTLSDLAKVTKIQSINLDVAKVVYTQTVNTNLAKVVYTQTVNLDIAKVVQTHKADAHFKDTDPNVPHNNLVNSFLKRLGKTRTHTTDLKIKDFDPNVPHEHTTNSVLKVYIKTKHLEVKVSDKDKNVKSGRKSIEVKTRPTQRVVKTPKKGSDVKTTNKQKRVKTDW